MAKTLAFAFSLGADQAPILPGDRQWLAPLPVSRHAFGSRRESAAFDKTVTYGDYFSAVRHFLEQEDFVLLNHALGHVSGGTLSVRRLDGLAVYLVKHGAYYHPARIAVKTGRRQFSFVLNVAVSRQGQEIMVREVCCLQRLTDELEEPFWPRVFGHGQGETCDGRRLPMFLGDWIEDFYEFHLTAGGKSTATEVVVWDTDNGPRHLSAGQMRRVLHRAALILAYAYHPLTFEAVRSWHHAAGDFVVRLLDDDLDLRLIAVRDYSPLIERPDPDITAVLEALPVMLVATSMRLRLDRLDGTGPLAVYPDSVVPTIWNGFRLGLQRGFAQRGLPDDLFAAAVEYISLFSAEKLAGIAADLVDRHSGNAAERDLLRRISRDHARRLFAAIAA